MGFNPLEQLPIDLLGSHENHILHKQKPTSTASKKLMTSALKCNFTSSKGIEPLS